MLLLWFPLHSPQFSVFAGPLTHTAFDPLEGKTHKKQMNKKRKKQLHKNMFVFFIMTVDSSVCLSCWTSLKHHSC